MAAAIRGLFDVIATVVDRFGWPGAALILAYTFVERNGTPQQKQEIVGLMINPAAQGAGPLLALLAVGVFVFFAQNRVWRRKLEAQEDEIVRLTDWKTQNQEARISERSRTAPRGSAASAPVTAPVAKE